MFILSNKKIKNSNLKINSYFLKYGSNVHVEQNENYLFILEGYLYPDLNYTKKNIIEFFLKKHAIKHFKNFKGKYCGVFIDFKKNKTYFFNDQLGLRDVFYYHKNKDIIISNNFSNIIKNIQLLEQELDYNALKEFLYFSYPLYNRTFHEHIKKLPLASIYLFNNEKLISSNYWKYELIEDKDFESEEAIEKLDKLFDKSIKRIIQIHGKNKTYGLGLSGGLDSRLVAHYALKNNIKLKTFIFGESNSEAYSVSKKLANILKVKHFELGFDKNFIKNSEKNINYNPMLELSSLWYYSVHDKLPKFNLLLTGFNGDNQFGSHLPTNLSEQNNLIVKQLEKKYSIISIDHTTKKEIINYLKNVNKTPMNKWENFNYNFRQLKFIKNNSAFNFLGKYEGESVFEDIDLVEFLLTIPYEWKLNKKLYLKFFKEKLPRLNKIKAERETRFQNKYLIFLEHVLRYFDIKIFKTNILFKKSHKNMNSWLKKNNFFKNYCKHIFRKENQIFNKNFQDINLKKILDKIYKGKASNLEINLFFRGLTILLFIDKIKKSTN